MNLDSLHDPAHLKVASVLSLALGLGLVFAEVRRFCQEPTEYGEEISENQSNGRLGSFCTGALLAFLGAVGVFNSFGFGSFDSSSHSPGAADPNSLRFLELFGGGLVGWIVFSFLTLGFLPSPLFGPKTAAVLSALVRGLLFLLWLAMFYFARHQIAARWQQNWLQEAIAFLLAALSLWVILKGAFGWGHVNYYDLPPITCADRPFRYLFGVLALMGATYGMLLGLGVRATFATFLGAAP